MERGQAASTIAEYFELAPPDQAAAIRLGFDRVKALVPDDGEPFAYGIHRIAEVVTPMGGKST